MTEPVFESLAAATFKRSAELATQRGGSYGDTWRDCQWLAFKAVADQLGIRVPDGCFRALALAAFADMKYQRLQGGFNPDHLDDGVNYQAALAEEMRRIYAKS